MAHRLLPAALIATALTASLAACGGGDGGDDRAERLRTAGRAAPVGTGFTSDQLEQALLTEAPGYRRAGEPDSGEYGSLKAIQNFNQLQRQVKLDKPRCANGGNGPGSAAGSGSGGSDSVIDRAAPSALTTFAKGNGQTVTETLMSLTAEAAAQQVKARVPTGCLMFRTRVGAQWSEHRVVESPPGRIGQGSRTVGVTTVSGGSHTKTWYVVLQGRRYLATISVFGPTATRTEAESLARLAYAQAERILP
ncbi:MULTISPECIES: hypothetical protein [Actinomadura]|uniref:PknH-like extracellular domain-containing protein n=1 Tax=Actinomadura yumaensis TaxID=111807 RepID=A0ABW2CH30_9ACTN|nr:hypothetical protein [Actinomadura sp. J1-007]MWK35030.1 hypothetical protein [Actinomadura sp. J1-007]